MVLPLGGLGLLRSTNHGLRRGRCAGGPTDVIRLQLRRPRHREDGCNNPRRPSRERIPLTLPPHGYMAILARRTSLIATLILSRLTWANSFGLDTGTKGCVVERLDAA